MYSHREHDSALRTEAQLYERIGRLEKCLDDLLGHWDAYTMPEWGNHEHAYYCLAKGAQDSWAAAREELNRDI